MIENLDAVPDVPVSGRSSPTPPQSGPPSRQKIGRNRFRASARGARIGAAAAAGGDERGEQRVHRGPSVEGADARATPGIALRAAAEHAWRRLLRRSVAWNAIAAAGLLLSTDAGGGRGPIVRRQTPGPRPLREPQGGRCGRLLRCRRESRGSRMSESPPRGRALSAARGAFRWGTPTRGCSPACASRCGRRRRGRP